MGFNSGFKGLIEIQYLQTFTITTKLLVNNVVYMATNFDPELRSSSGNDTRWWPKFRVETIAVEKAMSITYSKCVSVALVI